MTDDITDEVIVDPNPLGADVDEAVKSLGVTVSDGQVNVTRRRLVCFVDMRSEEREKVKKSGLPVGAVLEADIRNAMAIAAKRLGNEAMKYSVTNWAWNIEDIEYDIPSANVLAASLVLVRE